MTLIRSTLTRDERKQRIAELDDEQRAVKKHEHLTNVQMAKVESLTDERNKLRTAEVRESLRDGTAILEHTNPDYDQQPHQGHGQRDDAMRTVDAAVRNKTLPEYAADKVEKFVTDGSHHSQSAATRWAIAAGNPAYRTAFAKLCADPTRGHLLWTPEELAAYQDVKRYQTGERAMNITSSGGGQEMIPLTLDPAIVLSNDGSNNPLRKISRVVQTSTNSWTGVTSAGSTATWKVEAAEVADASPTLDDPAIPVHFGDAFVPYSFEVGMDSVNFLGELSKVLMDAADQLQATAFTTGTGSGQPKGIIKALTDVSEVAATADDTFAAGDVFKVQNALGARWQANAQWCAALPILNLIRQFETTNGALKFPELATGTLLSRPANELSNMDSTLTTSGAVDNLILLYGDFQQFVIVDRIGSTLELIPQMFHTGANRPSGQRGALLWFRTGSDALVPGAFKLLNAGSAA